MIMDSSTAEFCKLGEGIYQQLIKHEGIQFIFCPASLGDTVNVGAFLKTFKKIHGIKTVVIVAHEHHKSLTSIFTGMDEAVFLSEIENIGLRFYLSINKMHDTKNVRYGYFPMRGEELWEGDHEMFVSFVDEYKAKILDIPPDSQIDEIRIPEIDPANADRFRDCVLLMPFCRSFTKCHEVPLWRMLTEYYKERGKRVYTNVGNPEDKAIEGTEALSLEVAELLAYSDQFYKIIGMRGGIFDVLALRDDVRLDVITPELFSRFWGKCEVDITRHPLYFGLKNLNPNAKVREYSYNIGCEESLIREINSSNAVY